jgi:hypothetical protein
MSQRSITLFVAIMLSWAVSTVYAQGDDMPPPNAERLLEIKAQKSAYITTKLSLSPEEAQRFWPEYNAYDEAREELRRELRNVMRGGMQEGDAMSEAEADKALARGLALKQQELDLERTYKERFVKSIGAVRTVALFKAERDFQREVLRRFRDRAQGGGEEQQRRPPPRN